MRSNLGMPTPSSLKNIQSFVDKLSIAGVLILATHKLLTMEVTVSHPAHTPRE